MRKLHPNQKALLDLLRRRDGDLSDLTLREIGHQTGIGEHPQVVVHHLLQLEKKGLLRKRHGKKYSYYIMRQPVPEIASIKVYGLAECGPDGFFAEDCVTDVVQLPTRTFGITNPDDFFLVKARGDSMEQLIRPGDLVLARKQDDVDSGSIAVVIHDDVAKIKQLVKFSNGSEMNYSLVSLNPNYPPENIDESSQLDIVGLFRGTIHLAQK